MLGNLVFPKKPAGMIVSDSYPGYGGKWPEFIPTKEGDIRCACPAINALANHGIIAHDGRNISFVDLARHPEATYNIAPTFCHFILKFIARRMNKDYSKDIFDLPDLDAHNVIEHDGSLVRADVYFESDTAKIATALVEDLLGHASGKDVDGKPVLTFSDLSEVLSQRLAECKLNNPEFSMTFWLRLFGLGNCAVLQLVFGGKVEDLRPFLLEERIADGWMPWHKGRYGVTLAEFNLASAKIALRTKTTHPTMAATSPLSPDDKCMMIGEGLGQRVQDNQSRQCMGITLLAVTDNLAVTSTLEQ